jgi:hypothetical protein
MTSLATQYLCTSIDRGDDPMIALVDRTPSVTAPERITAHQEADRRRRWASVGGDQLDRLARNRMRMTESERHFVSRFRQSVLRGEDITPKDRQRLGRIAARVAANIAASIARATGGGI